MLAKKKKLLLIRIYKGDWLNECYEADKQELPMINNRITPKGYKLINKSEIRSSRLFAGNNGLQSLQGNRIMRCFPLAIDMKGFLDEI